MTMIDSGRTDQNGPEKMEGGGPPEELVRRQDDTPRLVRQRWQNGTFDLAKARRHFWQNMSFYLGEQWVWWDPARSILQTLPTAWSPLGPGRARLTVNRIGVNVRSVRGRMLASNLDFEVIPTESDDNAVKAAKTAEQVLHACHDDEDWESIRSDALFAAIMGGTSCVVADWDPTAGTQLEVEPNGKVIGTGNVRLQSLNLTEFCLEPGVREWQKARYLVTGLAMAPSAVQTKYGLSWQPRSDAAGMMSPLQYKILADAGRPVGTTLTLVLTMYERPNPTCPKGRVVTVVNGVTIQNSDWPFPFKHLNCAIFRQTQLSGQWQGHTYLNDAIPIQFAYNHARSLIAEHMKVAGNARLVAPHGAFAEEDFTNEAGSILWYSPDGTSGAPQYLSPPNLPRWIPQEASMLASELDDIMHVHDTSRGQASFDRASGQALAVLTEKDDSPLGEMAREQAYGWSRLSKMALELFEQHATETRHATVKSDTGIATQVAWNGKSLQGQTNVRIPIEVTEPRSKAAQRSFADSLWDRRIVQDPETYMRLAMIPRANADAVIDADVARAQRENARLIAGEVCMVEEFDDHAKHIAEHNRERKSDSYLFAEPEIRKIMDDHVQMHETQAAYEYGSQVGKAQIDPGLAMSPQAAEPVGSVIPPDFAEQRAGAASQQMVPPMNGPGGQNPPPPPPQGVLPPNGAPPNL